MGTETDDAVRDLYERFPYPRRPESLEPFLKGERAPTWNVRDSWSLYFPEKPPREDIDILLAGCGTTVAPRLAAVMPEARIVAVDISEQSLAISRALAETHGITNVEHVRCALEDVGQLKRTFDFVESHGVLHHLADPVAGLQALGEVTRPDGALGLMVYGKHGRTGLYMLQEACRRMGLGTDKRSGERVQALLTTLSPDHPFRAVHADPGQVVAVEEVLDMILHPRDIGYTVDDVKALVEGAGLVFQRWMGQGQYSPDVSPLPGVGLGNDVGGLDHWGQASVMELYYGVLIKHEFIVRPGSEATPETLFASDEAILDAYPRLSPYLTVERSGEQISLVNRAHQAAIRVGGPVSLLAPVLAEFDGTRTTRALLQAEGAGSSQTVLNDRAALVRQLYVADAVQLSVHPTAH